MPEALYKFVWKGDKMNVKKMILAGIAALVYKK